MICGMAHRAGHLELRSPFLPGCDSGPARQIEKPEYQVPSPPPTSITPATDPANVVTATNVAYAATSVSTSVNPAYQPVAPPPESDITASVNPAYRPLQGTSDSTSESMYDYARL